jgi:hypothetical protein
MSRAEAIRKLRYYQKIARQAYGLILFYYLNRIAELRRDYNL